MNDQPQSSETDRQKLSRETAPGDASANPPLKTKLHSAAEKLSAKFIKYGRWEMPLQFPGGILEEHKAVRTGAGIFDVSHMGKIRVQGEGAAEHLNRLIVNDSRTLKPGDARYTAMCNESGCPIDDLVLSLPDGDGFMMVVNASRLPKVMSHLGENLPSEIKITDLTPSTSLIALQGPDSEKILKAHCGEEEVLPEYYRVGILKINGVEVVSARLGYTGEDGFEFFCDNEAAEGIWNAFADPHQIPRAVPCGLGARDILRLEAGMSLYGNELTEEHNLFESGFGWMIDFEKGEFIGREALLRQKQSPLRRKLVSFKLEKGIPRQNHEIALPSGKVVGRVSSGGFSPILKAGIGMGFVEDASLKIGAPILIQNGSRKFSGVLVKRPFHKARP